MNWLFQAFSTYKKLFKKLAWDVSLTIVFPVGVRAVQSYLSERLKVNPDNEIQETRAGLKKLHSYPEAQHFLSINPNQVINANKFNELLYLLQLCYSKNNLQVQAELRRISDEVTKLANQKSQEQQNKNSLKHKSKLKVEYFGIKEKTADHITYAIQWTPHTIGFPILKSIDNPIKSAIESKISGVQLVADKVTKTWLLIGFNISQINQLIEVFQELGYDYSILQQHAEKSKDQEIANNEDNELKKNVYKLDFENVSKFTNYHIAIDFQKTFNQRIDKQNVFLSIVEFIFPTKGETPSIPSFDNKTVRKNKTTKREELIDPAGVSYFDKRNFKLFLRGNYNIYRDFQTLLKIKGFDTTSLNRIALMVGSELRSSNHIKKLEIVNGVLDHYTISRESGHRLIDKNTGLYINDEEKFKSEVDQYVFQKTDEQPYKLYPLQTDNVQWLYSRQSALLGDECGAGKTESLIVAADMRTRPDNLWHPELSTGRILIFTLSTLVPQWVSRINAAKGAGEKIATNIEQMGPGVKWLLLSYGAINVLTSEEQKKQDEKNGEDGTDSNEIVDMYNPFQGNARAAMIEELVNKLIAMNFDVLILDECHKVKNSSSATAVNIEKISKSIPFKWGASATMSANKPVDYFQQLRVVGHPLGYMEKNEFKQKFTEVRSEKMNGRLVDADPTNAKKFINLFVRKEIPDFDTLPLQEKQELSLAIAENGAFDELGGMTLKEVSDSQIKKISDLSSNLILTDVYHRKTKKQINPNLPEHFRKPNFIELNEREKHQLFDLADNILRNMSHRKKNTDQEITKTIAYRQAIALTAIPYTVNIAKDIILNMNQKVIIFTCFVNCANKINEELKKILNPLGFESYVSMGNDSGKLDNISRFKKEPQIKAYVLGVESSGTGVDLPNIVENVIVNDISWTPKDADQVEGRAFRVKSLKPVTTHYTVLSNTLGDTIYRTVQKKRDIASRIQEIDQEYANNIRNNKPITEQLKKSQNEHWNLVKEQLLSEVSVQHWTKQLHYQREVAAGVWSLKYHLLKSA